MPTVYLQCLSGSGFNPWYTSYLMAHSQCVLLVVLLHAFFLTPCPPYISIPTWKSRKYVSVDYVTYAAPHTNKAAGAGAQEHTQMLVNSKAHVPSAASHRLSQSLKTGEALRGAEALHLLMKRWGSHEGSWPSQRPVGMSQVDSVL